MRRVWIITLAVCIARSAFAQGAYPEPPMARQTFAITDQIIAQAKTSSNPLSNFLRQNEGRYKMWPTATIIPPGGWTVVWPEPALATSEKYFVSWSKGNGRFWGVDCVSQKVVQILGTTPVDLNCSHWAAMADKEVELYFFYRQ